jgi:hypothetical protein
MVDAWSGFEMGNLANTKRHFFPKRTNEGCMKFCRSVLLLAVCISTAAVLHSQDLTGSTIQLSSQVRLSNPALNSTPIQLSELSFRDDPGMVAAAPAPPVSTSSGSFFSGVNPQAGEEAWRPLTGQERLILFWSDTYASPGAFVALSISAMKEQMTGTPAKWDADGNGYTRRFASGYGQLAARTVVHEGLAGLTGLDPRYIPCHCEGTIKRTTHALKMTFITYSRSGRVTLDVPQIAGAYGSGMVSTYWYPHALYNPLVQGVQFGHVEMGEVFVGNFMQEFGPDIKRALHLHAIASRASADLDDSPHSVTRSVPPAPKAAPNPGADQASLKRNPIS